MSQLEEFDDAAAFIGKAKEENGVVVLNCARGRSRSVAICLYYLMKYENMDLKEAYTFVKERREIIGPSRHLKPQLIAMEKKIHKKNSFVDGEKWSKETANTRKKKK